MSWRLHDVEMPREKEVLPCVGATSGLGTREIHVCAVCAQHRVDCILLCLGVSVSGDLGLTTLPADAAGVTPAAD